MLQQLKKFLFKSELEKIGSEVFKQFETVKEVITAEVKNYENKIKELENKLNQKENYITNLDKKYSSLLIEMDIMQSKLKEQPNKNINKELEAKIFGED